jgi:hypothetical protein
MSEYLVWIFVEIEGVQRIDRLWLSALEAAQKSPREGTDELLGSERL